MPPGLAARKPLLDLFGEQVKREAQIDFDAPDDVFSAQLAAHVAALSQEEPRIEAAERWIRRMDGLSRARASRPMPVLHVGRVHTRRRETGRRTVRTGPRRTRAPARSGGDDSDSEPEPPKLAVSVRWWAHEQRRLARRRDA